MSVAPTDSHGIDDSLAPAIVQALRDHGEALVPDAASRERIWHRIEAGMRREKPRNWIDGLCALWQPTRRWAPILALMLVAAIGVPLFLENSPAPDWNSVEFKGTATARLGISQRADFIAGLRQRGVSFDTAPQAGAAAILMRPDEQQKLDTPFRQTWGLPASDRVPLIVIFE